MKPFDKYPNGGRALCDPLLGTDCRYSYGRVVVSYCGTDCVYCGIDVAVAYRAWLFLSVDHVVPQRKIAAGYNEEWIHDLSNQVSCCRACNELLNRIRVDDPPPQSLSEFHDLRDRVYIAKQTLAVKRHEEEKAWHAAWQAGTRPYNGRFHKGR